MFKKTCRKCGNKIEKDFRFCPHCGNNSELEREMKDYGFLGKNDNSDSSDFGIKLPFGMNTLFNTLLKEVDKQMRQLDKQIGEEANQSKETKPKSHISSGISINISTAPGKEPQIKLTGFGPEFGNIQNSPPNKRPVVRISDEQAEKLASLPRKEAETQIRRLSNKLLYEIDMPGVKSLKEVIINKLENSIEVKAFSEKEVYFKLIPLNLPILNYSLEAGKLILELKS